MNPEFLFYNVLLINTTFILLILAYRNRIVDNSHKKDLNILMVINLLNILGPLITDWFDAKKLVVLTNILVTLALFLKYHLISRTIKSKQKNINKLVFFLSIGYLFINIFFFHIIPNYTIRASAFSLMTIIYYFSLNILVRKSDLNIDLKKFLITIFYVLASISAVRLLITFEQGPTSTIFENNLYNQIHVAAFLLGELIFTPFYFLIIHNLNLEALKIKEIELIKVNDKKDKLFSIIGHDLKNPFHTLLGYSSLCADNEDLPRETIKKYATVINSTAKSTYEMLENLLDWSRINSKNLEYKSEKIETNKLVESINRHCGQFANDKGIKLSINFSSEYFIKGNTRMMSSILTNLVNNAIKFSYSNSEVRCEAYPNGDFFNFKISDQGVGITGDKLKTLFDSKINESTLGTGNEIGTGLGLIICKELVTMQGGKLWADSIEGKGTEFYFTIPIWHEENNMNLS